jgi:ABC-2 type transport system permease protein
MNAVCLYFRYLGVSVRSQMQYRGSFIMMSLGNFAITAIEIVGIWALFERFHSLGGWTFADVALFYGMIHVSFALAEAIARGFDDRVFSALIRTGNFDRILLRPRSAAFQVAGQEVQLMRIGRLTQGLIVLIWAANTLNLDWTAAKILLLLFAIFGGACLFYGLFAIHATMVFWSTEALELMNIFTYGGTETAQYPLTIYRPWFRRIFTFVIPLGCVTYFPAIAILEKEDAALDSPLWFQGSAPIIGVLFLWVSLKVWNFGVRHYRSTGS